ncbi:MAG TPA: FAD-dependent oxidoreductase [Crenalkalicoccus sp.]|nr:FAD-dependent oxidoreductase [Crenalkalicoccus sp.]
MVTDVLVIGAGLAGFCASLEALAAGRAVVLLEKQPEVGGSTVLSGGAMAFAGTEGQAEAGIEDSDDRLREDLLRVGERRNDPALVEAYVEAQLDTWRWLRGHGVRFTSVQLGGGQSVPRSNRVDPRQMISALAECAGGNSCFTLRVGTPARRLIREGDRITGARTDDEEIRARHGVVLASGGFSRDETLLALFAPAQRDALRIGGRGNTGDGLRMACAMGAGLADIGYIRGTFGTHPDAGSEQLSIIHAIYKGGIAVNRHGMRFIDESLSYKIIGDACLQQPGGLAFQIFDQPIMELSVPGVATSDMRAGLADGRVLQADTLEALAQRAGIDPDGLRSTLARYNADVATGRDTLFGRDGLSSHYGKLRAIGTAPFYAFPSTSSVLATYGGLALHPQMRVRDVFGAPIPGLFAAGEVTGGLHGAAYMTGSSLGKSAIFGRIAGRNAAGA